MAKLLGNRAARHFILYLKEGIWTWLVLLTSTGYFAFSGTLDFMFPEWQTSKTITQILGSLLLFLTSFRLWSELKAKNEELENKLDRIQVKARVWIANLWFNQSTNGTLVLKTDLGAFVLLTLENTGDVAIPALGAEVTINGFRVNYYWTKLNGNEVLEAQPKAIRINQTDSETMVIAKRYEEGWATLEDWRKDLMYLNSPMSSFTRHGDEPKQPKFFYLKSYRTEDPIASPLRVEVNLKAENFEKKITVLLAQNEPVASVVSND